ncbi:hypothetical protein J7E91_33335, partial [Streptomyces sp. ISL-99]|nr:hypothetical protein [Streptomyces sp. ISL-99]
RLAGLLPFRRGGARGWASAVSGLLGSRCGFGGTPGDYQRLESSLLHEVLRRRRGQRRQSGRGGGGGSRGGGGRAGGGGRGCLPYGRTRPHGRHRSGTRLRRGRHRSALLGQQLRRKQHHHAGAAP